jgi:hypothetical protein
MIRDKTKMGVLIKIALIILSVSSLLFLSGADSALALPLTTSGKSIVATTATSTIIASTSNAPGIDCSVNLNPLTWLICPIISGMQALVDSFDGYITSALTVNPCTYFDTSDNPVISTTDTSNGATPACNQQTPVQAKDSSGFYAAWSSLRDIALGLMVIGALIMIISQVLGFELLDAYTIRKVLPRLIIAAIGISLSWQLMQFLIQFSNDLGDAVGYLIYTPFKSLAANGGVVVSAGTSSAAAILGAGAISSLSIIGELTFVLVAVVAALLGFVVVILRQILIVFLALLAPLAIAMFILPATSKIWKLWWNTLFKALLMFPLIVGMIAVGRIFAEISSQTGSLIGQFIAFIAYFGPYFIIPQAFKFAGGALAVAGGAVSRAGKSFNKGMSGYRSKNRKQVHEKRQAGDTRLTSGRTGNLYRRATISGGLSPFAKGQSRFRAKDQLRNKALSENAIKQDGGIIAGDDIATGLALQAGMTGGRFIKEYSEKLAANNNRAVTADDQNKARDALSTIQTNFGTRMGSASMRVAAFKARAASVSSYVATDRDKDPDSGLRQLYSDGGSMIRDGLMNSDAVAQASKAAKARVDRSTISYGTSKQMYETAASRETGQLKPEEIKALRDSALEGATAGEFVKSHTNAVDELAAPMINNLKESIAPGGDKTKMYKQLANIDNIYSTLSATSPKVAEKFATEIMSQHLSDNGQDITVRQYIDKHRNDDEFKNFKPSFMMPGGSGNSSAPDDSDGPVPEES